MSLIKTESDLLNDKEVIEDKEDYSRCKASMKLMNELEKGRRSGETEGFKTLEEAANLLSGCDTF
jgi:hypothetical protein